MVGMMTEMNIQRMNLCKVETGIDQFIFSDFFVSQL
jgi:hypothetical protein